MGRTAPSVLHADLDAFYASVEQLDDPSLAGRPVIVGGLGPRGVVAAASYEARRFGVHSAVPMARARRACPEGVFVAPRFDRYSSMSKQFMAILRSFTPLVEPLALDEAFLDVEGVRRIHGEPETIGAEIRQRVRNEVGLAVSVGAGSTKLIAKLASDLAKPDGLRVVAPGTELAFLHPLPVERLFGVGPATRKRLDGLSIQTIGDLAARGERELTRAVGDNAAHRLLDLAWNRDDRAVEPERERKSVGHEETFDRDLHDRAALERELDRMALEVGSRLRAAGVAARTVQLKVRFAGFRTITRSRTLPQPTDVGHQVRAVARELLDAVDLERGVRLLGISGQQLVTRDESTPSLFGRDADDDRRAALEHTVDAVRARFGTGSVRAGTHDTPQSPTPEDWD